MSKVYAYCRVARDDDNSLERQRREVEEYCSGHGMVPHKYFCELSSGITMNRELLKTMLYDLSTGDTVVVKDRARISRHPAWCQMILNAIEEQGAKLIIINEVGYVGPDFEKLLTIWNNKRK